MRRKQNISPVALLVKCLSHPPSSPVTASQRLTPCKHHHPPTHRINHPINQQTNQPIRSKAKRTGGRAGQGRGEAAVICAIRHLTQGGGGGGGAPVRDEAGGGGWVLCILRVVGRWVETFGRLEETRLPLSHSTTVPPISKPHPHRQPNPAPKPKTLNPNPSTTARASHSLAATTSALLL